VQSARHEQRSKNLSEKLQERIFRDACQRRLENSPTGRGLNSSRLHKSFQCDLACDHFNNVLDILAVLSDFCSSFVFVQHKLLKAGGDSLSSVFDGPIVWPAETPRTIDRPFLLRARARNRSCENALDPRQPPPIACIQLPFSCARLDSLPRRKNGRCDFPSFLCRVRFRRIMSSVVSLGGKIAEAESLREFQIAAAFRLDALPSCRMRHSILWAGRFRPPPKY